MFEEEETESSGQYVPTHYPYEAPRLIKTLSGSLKRVEKAHETVTADSVAPTSIAEEDFGLEGERGGIRDSKRNATVFTQ